MNLFYLEMADTNNFVQVSSPFLLGNKLPEQHFILSYHCSVTFVCLNNLVLLTVSYLAQTSLHLLWADSTGLGKGASAL